TQVKQESCGRTSAMTIGNLGRICQTLLVAGTVLAAGTGADAAVKMRMATEVAAGGDVAVLLDEFRAAIEERQPDADVKVFTGGSLGTQRQLQEQIELGTIEAIGTASDIVEMAGEFSI